MATKRRAETTRHDAPPVLSFRGRSAGQSAHLRVRRGGPVGRSALVVARAAELAVAVDERRVIPARAVAPAARRALARQPAEPGLEQDSTLLWHFWS